MQATKEQLDHANNIIKNGTDEERLAFFAFDKGNSKKVIHFKFIVWAHTCYPRYFQSVPAEFHEQIIDHMIDAYYGRIKYTNLGFRGCAKTTWTKLWVAYVILNDMDHTRKYMKVLTRNVGNAKQLVTDVYNLIVEVKDFYGDIFQKDGDKKREETMGSFTTVDGVKLLSGTVGMTQRGHLQDASRPDFIMFDDVEDRESIQSLATTEATIWRIDEAIAGLSAEGSYMCNGNYISEEGVIQWFLNKPDMVVDKITIMDEDGNPTWPARYDKEKIDSIKNDADDFYGEYMCLKPDTMILTKGGLVPINTVTVGDKVITHKGREQEVLKVMRNQGDDMLDITVDGVTVTITKNHPVLTDMGWLPAGELSTGVYCFK